MVKLLLILLLVYLLFRAGRNLLQAAIKDGLMPSDDHERGGRVPPSRQPRRTSTDERDVEDAVWEDLPEEG